MAAVEVAHGIRAVVRVKKNGWSPMVAIETELHSTRFHRSVLVVVSFTHTWKRV